MKKFEITEQDAQKILNYISQIPTGSIPLGVALEIVQILMNLKEIKEK
jgi:hypothetical protein